MMDKIREFFGIVGGELLAIEKRITKVGTHKLPDELRNAERQYVKLKNDMQWSNSTPLQQEIDNRELNRLGELVKQKQEIEEAQTRELLILESRKDEIEQQILYFRRRKKMLDEIEKPKIEGQISALAGTIKQCKYEADRDKRYILSQINDIQDKINGLIYKKDMVLKKDDPERLDLIVSINELEAQKGAILQNEYKATMLEVNEKLNRAEKAQQQINAIQLQFDEALRDVDEKLIMLTGRAG